MVTLSDFQQGIFICTIPYRIAHTTAFVLIQLWSSGWNEKQLSGSTMRNRSDDPVHHERCSAMELYLTTHSESIPWNTLIPITISGHDSVLITSMLEH